MLEKGVVTDERKRRDSPPMSKITTVKENANVVMKISPDTGETPIYVMKISPDNGGHWNAEFFNGWHFRKQR